MITIKQLCAKYILENPGSGIRKITPHVREQVDKLESKTVAKQLKRMTDLGEINREGVPGRYVYYAGEHIGKAIKGKKVVTKPPVKLRRGKRTNSMMQIKQTWVAQGDYTIEPGEMIYRSLWSYADSFCDKVGTTPNS